MDASISDTPAAPAKLAIDEPPRFIGVVPNAAHQSPRGIFEFRAYELAIVEFDDQGRCYNRTQMDEVAAKLDSFAGSDAIVVVFVHGWKHNARSHDENLAAFQKVLLQTVQQEHDGQATVQGVPRPVLGVFVGWRGMTLYDRFGLSENLTFWDRQEAGRRVAVGSVRELFGRLRHYRNVRKDEGGAPLLVIVGHSFGGMIVYSALAQSLIEAAAAPASEVTPRFADLVLLVNPAVEAARYLPIYDLVKVRMQKDQQTDQPPVFVCATAKNDWATGLAFPLGNAFSLLSESYLDREERQAMVNTIGHLPWMKTHDLVSSTEDSGYKLVEVSPEAKRSAYWVIQASPAIIDGHNGIFKNTFLGFVANLVFQHVWHSLR